MKNIIMILLVSFIGFAVQAQEKKSKKAKYEVEVAGNCEMCKKRIEKAAYSVPGVKSAVWNTDDQKLHLVINEEKCSVMNVEQAVANAGHDTKAVKSSEESYKKLHECCQYDR